MSKGDLTRSRILDQAIGLSSVDGITGLTLGRLAESVGMSKSGLFAHFRSKEELQVQVLAATVERFEERVIRPALTAPRGEARIRALFDRWIEWDDDDSLPGGCLFTQAAAELDDQPGAPRDVLAQSQNDWRDFLAGAARLAIQVGEFRSDMIPELFAFQMLGIALARHMGKRLMGDPQADAKARAAFDALVAAARA